MQWVSRYPPGDLLEDEKDEDEKKISIRFEGGQMPLHVVQSSTYAGLAIVKLRGRFQAIRGNT